MNPFTIKTKAALALLVAASLPQVAQAKPFEPSAPPAGRDLAVTALPPAAVDAMGARYDALAKSYAATGTAASHFTPQALNALGARYDAMTASYAARGTAASHFSPQALDALGARYDAAATSFAAKNSSTTGYVVGGQLVPQGQAFTPATAIAPATDGTRPDDRAGALGVDPTPVAAAAASPGGFDWSDAGIGMAGGLGISLLLVGGLVLGLTARRHEKVVAA